MVEKTNTTNSDMYYVNDNALDGSTISAAPVNIVAESRVPAGVFQAFVLVAASVDVSFVGRVDVSSGYFGASYHLSSTDVDTFDNSVMDFNYIDNSLNAIQSDLFSGTNMLYFPQDTSFSQFKKPNVNSAGNFTAMSHRMNVYGRGLPAGSLAPYSILVKVTKVYATLPISGFEDIMAAHTRVNELSSEQMYNVHNFVKESGFAVRSGRDAPVVDKFLKMLPFEQKEIIQSKGDSQDKRRDNLIARIKNYHHVPTRIDLNN